MAALALRALILVENQSVPRDPRVWPECLALRDAGYDVAVICPRGTEDADAYESRDGVEIYRYRPAFANGSRTGYVREYATALWRTWRLARRVAAGRAVDVVQACNPPDLLLLAALPLKRRGARFLFDHHDLVPELYQCRFGGRGGIMYRIARITERLTFRLADVVISTNESYREVALRRGGKNAEDVFVVRNAPDVTRFRPAEPEPALKRGKPYLLAFVGVMGPQDGVDYALRALARLRERRDDWHALFVGDGDTLADMQRLAAELGLGDHVEFTGFLYDADRVRQIIATADVCLAPEPKNELNDRSTMIKIAEYMAMARPVVCFDLTESRVTAGDAALYAPPNDEDAFADCVERLLGDPELRRAMGVVGRARVEDTLSWERSKEVLLAAYERALVGRGNGRV